ncbi:hypothetical protein G6F43_001917 [Rhizopus delemar]|nr:hypothetical protein G6F43_001917 [Rhizopus delemar]
MFDILDRNLAVPFFTDKNKKELIELKYGTFSCYFYEGHRTIKQTLYEDAVLCLKRTESPFAYELVVSGISNAKCFYDSRQTFKVQKNMHLRIYRINMNQDVCLTWTVEGLIETFEFVCNRDVLQEAAENFMAVAYECIYENEYKSPRTLITESKLLSLYSAHVESKTCSEILKAKTEVYGTFIPDDANDDSTSTFIRYVPYTGTEPTHGTPLLVLEATLFIYRPDVRDYIVNGKVFIKISESESFTYHMEVYSTEIPSIYQTVDVNMNPIFKHDELEFYWNYYENKRAYSFKVTLNDREVYEGFKELLTKSIFEVASKSLFSRYRRQNQDYIINTLANNAASFMDSDSEEEDDEGEGDKKVNEDNSAQNNEAKDLFYSDGSQKNSILSTGHKSNLSFVIRGNKVGIYSLYGSGINFTRSIQDIQTINGKNPLYPTNAILHDQESSYLLYDVNMKNNIVYKMDLGRGEVVEEWKVNDENLLINICPNPQTLDTLNNDQTIVGITSNSLFRIDPRQKRINKINDLDYKKYSSMPEFSTVASSRSKYVAVGSKKGVIRIFSELNKVAAITLPPIGEPILGLDVTLDGRYLIATCSNFLILVHTLLNDQAITLRIKPEHVTLMNEAVSFKRAYFDIHNRNDIVCITGSFVVIWNFKNVCQGDFTCYKMQRLEAPIVSSTSDSKDDLIIAFEDQVSRITKTRLQ